MDQILKESVSSDTARSRVVSGAAIAIESTASGRYANAALASSETSARSAACTVAANRKGSVSRAAIAAMRQ